MTMIILAVLYVIGCLLSYWMLRVDQESEKEIFTHGARALTIILSLFSFLMVLITLISAWISKIKKSEYWSRPVKPTAEANEHH